MKKRNKIREDFLPEYHRLQEAGMQESSIVEFYWSAAHAAITNDESYRRHNRSLESNMASEKHSPDIFCYRRGSEKAEKKSEAELEDTTGWCNIKIIMVPLVAEEDSEHYLEHVEITEQVADKELREAIMSLSSMQQEILELVLDDWPQIEIAKRLGISAAAVCKNIGTIRKRLEPYFRFNHWLKVN